MLFYNQRIFSISIGSSVCKANRLSRRAWHIVYFLFELCLFLLFSSLILFHRHAFCFRYGFEINSKRLGVIIYESYNRVAAFRFQRKRRLKTWLCSTMSQKRLNSLSILQSNQLTVDKLSFANEFVNNQPTRQQVRGKFTVKRFIIIE